MSENCRGEDYYIILFHEWLTEAIKTHSMRDPFSFPVCRGRSTNTVIIPWRGGAVKERGGEEEKDGGHTNVRWRKERRRTISSFTSINPPDLQSQMEVELRIHLRLL